MSYITQQDLVEELGESQLVQLTDDGENDEIGSAVVAKAIEYAAGVFDSYARTRYSLPVPATPLVKSCCVNLAVYHLFRKRATFDDGAFKVKKTAYDESIQLLKDIQSGRAALDVPAAKETIETPASSDKVLTNAAKAKFTDSKLSSF